MANASWKEMREQAEKDGGFSPHPIGTYNFKVVESNTKMGTSTLQIATRLENIDPGPNQGKTVLNRMAPIKNDGNPNPMFYQQIGALGFTEDHPLWTQLESMDLEQGIQYIATQIMGATAICEIAHDSYNNQVRDNVKSMKPSGSTAVSAPAAVPAPVAAPVAPAPAPAPAPVPQAAPVAPVAPVAPAPVAPVPAPVPAQEATPAPQTEEQVVAQMPQPVAPVSIPAPPDAPF